MYHEVLITSLSWCIYCFTAVGWCDCSSPPDQKHSVTLTPLSHTEYHLFNICDFLTLNLSSALNNCSTYAWYLRSDLAQDPTAVQTLECSQEKCQVNLRSPKNCGVYCRDGCLSEYYCAAIAGLHVSKFLVVLTICGLCVIYSCSHHYLLHFQHH